MKRLICIVLTAIFVLGLCACGGKKQAQKEGPVKAPEGKMLVGFGRVDLTPESPMELVGYGGNGTAQIVMTGVLDHIFATCVAITDTQGNTALIYTVDTLDPGGTAVSMVRQSVAKATGISEDNLAISATHTHSSPRASKIPGYVEKLTQAAQDALKDRAPATIQAGSTETENMNFVRHYVTDRNKIIGNNFGTYKEDGQAIRHTTEADPEMQLIRFVRENDKKDVLMVNWQAHAKVASTNETQEGQATRSMLSADFPGFFRTYVEENSELLVAYYSGASGNLNPRSDIYNENRPGAANVKVYSQILGDYAIEALGSLQAVEAGSVEVRRKQQEVNLAGSPNTANQDITAISIGNIGFATVPFEMFDTNGMQIKDGSPYDITFVLTNCNNRDGYIPAQEVFDYNPGDARLMPYEVKSCAYAKGTAETVAQGLIDMLNDIAGK